MKEKEMLRKILGISKEMEKFKENPDSLIKKINSFDKKYINGVKKYYLSKGNKKINEIRLEILNILEKKLISEKKIDEIKDKINKKYKKNILSGYKNFGILYYIYYYQYNKEIKDFLEKFSDKIINDLNAKEFTKKHIVDFNGSQNQGLKEIWFAIYNKSYKSHKTAKQLYFSIGGDFNKNGICTGIWKHGGEKDRLIKMDVKNYDYDKILEQFRRFLDEIKIDIFKEGTNYSNKNGSKLINLLNSKKQIILYGPPGTGKTYKTKKYSVEVIEK